MKMWRNLLSHNVKESKKKNSWIRPVIAPKVKGVCSGLRHIRHPSFNFLGRDNYRINVDFREYLYVMFANVSHHKLPVIPDPVRL